MKLLTLEATIFIIVVFGITLFLVFFFLGVRGFGNTNNNSDPNVMLKIILC